MAVWKVRMLVLDLVSCDDPEEAKRIAQEGVLDLGLTVLQVEEPDAATPPATYGSSEGDIYP